MRVLILSHNRSDSDDAYNHRLRSLRDALCAEGIDARMSYLGDGPLGRPTALHALTIGRAEGIGEADVLHAGSAAVAFACALLPKRTGRRIVFDMHGDTVAEAELCAGGSPAGRLRVVQERIKEKIGLARADRVLVVSGPLRKHVIGLGVPAERIAIFPNGVDLERFVPSGPPPRRDVPLVVYAGRFEAWQGVESLERLAARSGRSFRLRVIGFTEEDRVLEERIRAASPGAVETIRRVPQEELARLLEEGDLLLIPREPSPAAEVAMPTKFGEYLALGRPVLLTRVGEPAALVEEERCGIVTGTGGDALADGVTRFAALPVEERRAMGERARALAERVFDWKKIGAAYAAYLRDLAGEGGR